MPVVHGDNGGVDEGAGDRHGGELVRLEVACRRDRQDEREEVHERVRGGVEHLVGVGGVTDPAEGEEHGEERLEQAGSRQRPQHRGEDRGDEPDKGVERVELLLGPALPRVRAQAGQEPRQLLVEDGDVVANDHLVLAAGLDHGDHPVERLNALGRGLGLVLEDEAQAGGAVAHGGDVGLTPHALQQARRQCRVVRLRHWYPP